MELYINNSPAPVNTWYPIDHIRSFQFVYNGSNTAKYSIIMYDLDAPKTSPHLHLLITNIPGTDITRGNMLQRYVPPSPPSNSAPHRYNIDLYIQGKNVSKNVSFPVDKFVREHGMVLIGSKTIVVDPSTSMFYIEQSIPSMPQPTIPQQQPTIPQPKSYSHYEIIRSDTGLTDQEQRYCACLVGVAAKQPAECLLEKAWYERREGKVCANPYPVCTKSVGTNIHKCSPHYKYPEMSDEQLIGFANLHGIDVPRPYNRQTVLSIILQKYGLQSSN